MPEGTNSTPRNRFLSLILDNSLAVAAIVIVLFMFLPLNKFFIDVFMVLNLALSLIVLLTVINTKRAPDFSSFPQLVLFITLFGLAINVSSTRNILIHPVVDPTGHLDEQSEMVQAFANIVAGNNVVVGFIIFIILIVVQMLVITKGADRVSEVTARFTLDAMNNKMFTIQNQMQSGSITEEEGNQKIAYLQKEIDFYSAMDGSSKFVSGNVKAGIFITVINLVGGIITGMIAGLNIGDAFKSYAKLTIGDGLMSQLPALLISFSTGLLITGGSGEDLITEQFKKQFSTDGTIYIIVGATLMALGLAFHNNSTPVLMVIGAFLVFFGVRLIRIKRIAEVADAKVKENETLVKKSSASDEISPHVKVDDLSLEIGYALIPLVDKEKGAELLERVTRIRREVALDLGLVVPPIHIMDQMELSPEEYSFKIRGIEKGRSKIKMGYYMCLNSGNVSKDAEITGEHTKDPSFGIDAIWIPESKRVEAENAGYAIVDPPTIIATHLTEIIRNNAADILSRQEVSDIIEKVKETNSVVVDEVLTGEGKLSYGEIEAVLKNLLSEQVSIRNMVTILETLSDYARYTHNVYDLTEKVREALGAQICQQYVDENNILHVINISSELAQKILEHKVELPGKKPAFYFDPVDTRKYIENVSATITQVRGRNYLPIILCADEIRLLVKSSIERELPGVNVLSLGEVMAAGSSLKIESLGEINGQ